MNTVKHILFSSYEYIKTLLKWVFIAVLIGILGGLLGSAFHESIEYVTHFRTENPLIILLLPIGGLLIAAMYAISRKFGKIDTNRVIDSASKDEKVPLVMIPIIFISSVITHLLGGSAGREGAALQLGGSMGYNIGRFLKLDKNNMRIIVMTGMSSVFAALFGTPLTAAFFAIEVACVGILHYTALIPCVISSIVAYRIAVGFGIMPVAFRIPQTELTTEIFIKVLFLAVLCAIVSIAFCTAIKNSEKYMKKFLPNAYIRGAVGGVIIVLLTTLAGSLDYNGTGMDIISKAMSGMSVRPEAFLLKIIFTAITVAAGFRGGEIVPAFFVGATFGSVIGTLLGLDPAFAAAIGFVSLFCGIVNCPTASVFLALEVFGSDNILIFAIVCGISYIMSGNFGLYKSQKIMYSKLDEHYIDENTK